VARETGYFGLRRSSQADRENTRTPAPLIHSGTATPLDELAIDLCLDVGQTREFAREFFFSLFAAAEATNKSESFGT
jgi:hypothetical protein